MKVIDELKMLTTEDTIVLEATLDSDGHIKTIEQTPIFNVNDLFIVGTNIIMNTILTKNYGIDVAGIVSNLIPDSTPRIVCLSSFIKNCDWENATIKDNSTTPASTIKVMKYIKKKFQITSSGAFVDEVYSRVKNAFVSSQYNYDKKFIYVHLDGETNQMINILAVVIGSNATFMEVPIGQDSIINIPFDKEHLDRIEDFLYDYLKDNGYIDGDSLPSISFPAQIYDIFTNTPLDSDDYFQYCHIQILKSKQTDAWVIYGYFTHEEIEYLETIPTYVHQQGWSWNRTGFAVRCRPYTSDGVINDTNLCGFVSSNAEGQRLAGCMMNSATTPFAAANSNGHNSCYSVWCRRSDFTDPTTETYYNELCYNGNGTNGVTDISWSGHLNGINMPYNYSTAYGDQWRNLGYWEWSDDIWHGIWAWNWCTFTNDEPYVDDYVYDVTKADKINVIINNQNITSAETLSQPTIDSTTAQNLQDNNIGIIGKDDDLDIYIVYEDIADTYEPSQTPFDTSYPLKIATCDPMLNVLINDPNTQVTSFQTYARATWQELWVNGIHLKYNSAVPIKLGMGMPYYLTEELLQDVAEDLWDDDVWTKFARGLKDPAECIYFLKQLPYKLIEDVDYTCGKYGIDDQCYYNNDGTMPIKYGNVFPKLRGGKSRGYGIINPVHEITFVLAGDNKIKHNHNFTDYSPYVKTMIYLPFVGTREIPPEFIMNTDLIVKYRISNITGNFICMLASLNKYTTEVNTNGKIPLTEQDFEFGAPIFIEQGNMAIDRQWSGQDADGRGVISGITQALTSCLGGYSKVGSILNHSGNNTLSNTNKFSHSGVSNSFDSLGNVLSSGIFNSNVGTNKDNIVSSFSGDMSRSVSSLTNNISFGGAVNGLVNAGISLLAGSPVNHSNAVANDGALLNIRYPYIIMSYNPVIEDCGYYSAFDKTIGYTSMHGISIKNMSPHYHELMSVKLEGINCTSTERDMIRNILMTGFYNGLGAGEQLFTPD